MAGPILYTFPLAAGTHSKNWSIRDEDWKHLKSVATILKYSDIQLLFTVSPGKTYLLHNQHRILWTKIGQSETRIESIWNQLQLSSNTQIFNCCLQFLLERRIFCIINTGYFEQKLANQRRGLKAFKISCNYPQILRYSIAAYSFSWKDLSFALPNTGFFEQKIKMATRILTGYWSRTIMGGRIYWIPKIFNTLVKVPS